MERSRREGHVHRSYGGSLGDSGRKKGMTNGQIWAIFIAFLVVVAIICWNSSVTDPPREKTGHARELEKAKDVYFDRTWRH